MNTVQFDPKITSELQIDWRRPSHKDADPFTDFLKQHFEVDQRARAPKKREEAADPVSGRPPRVVITHAKTPRGEAKRVEDADRRLPDQSGQPRAEACANGEETAALEDGAATDAGASEQDAAEVPAETDTDATAEQPTPVVENEAEVVEPVAAVVVSVQSTDEADVNGEAVMTATPVVEPTEDGIPPEQTEQPANASSDGTETDPEAATEGQAVVAMAEAGLTEGAAALMTGEATPTAGATPAAAVAQAPALPTTPAKPEQPLLQMVQTPVPVVEPVPAAQVRPEHSSMDIKLRAGTPPRATPATPASPATGTPAQPAQPHATTLLQPTTASEFGEPFDQAWSEDDTGQGWALHLAQGAASKRPDFVAQLRQHLQNLPAHEQVAVHLQRAVREGTNKFSIQLSPAELGSIHVKLEIDEEKRVTAAVTVERPSTLELLQRDTKGLERALHNAGLNMEGGDLSFSLGRGDRDFAQDLRQSGASATGGLVLDAESDGDQPVLPVAQVTDTAAGVVNLQV